MGSHPINLALRFLLELSALAAVGVWGWKVGEGWLRYLLVLGIPIALALAWGAFAVPNDPSRSGTALVAVPGLLRLLIELTIFGLAVWLVWKMSYVKLFWIFTILVVFHYVISYDRIRWLLAQ